MLLSHACGQTTLKGFYPQQPLNNNNNNDNDSNNNANNNNSNNNNKNKNNNNNDKGTFFFRIFGVNKETPPQ